VTRAQGAEWGYEDPHWRGVLRFCHGSERESESETGVGKERKESDKRAPQGNKEMNETHSICKFEIEFTFELNFIQIILPGSKNWNENMRR
jgi:hypothetical protein